MTDDLFITTALGGAGSGRVRYGAAMALYRSGQISAEQLECYRVASADDFLDPFLLMRQGGMSPPAKASPSGEAIVSALVSEADSYLSKLSGPGIAEVRQGIAAFRDGPCISGQPQSNPVVEKYLATALSAASATESALSALIAAAAPLLSWVTYDLYDRSKIGEAFATSHAFCTMIGQNGFIKADDFDFGLFLIAPQVLYRDHHHAAPELYAPLTGPHGWRFMPNAPLVIKPAHEPVWNEPFRPHLTKVGPIPFLCLYGWTRDNDKPAEVIPASDWPMLEALVLG